MPLPGGAEAKPFEENISLKGFCFVGVNIVA